MIHPRHKVGPDQAISLQTYAAFNPVRILSSLALGIALCGGHVAYSWAADTQTSSQKTYAIRPGALEDVLTEYAASNGIALSFAPELVAGKTSAGLNGTFSRQQGFEQLLLGTGLALQEKGSGYTLIKLPLSTKTADKVTTLSEVNVRASADEEGNIQQEGKASDGYRVKTVSSVGGLGSMKLQDTPFSISVIPQELIQNIQAQSPDDLYRLNPSTRTATPQVTGWSPMVNIRGFNSYDSAEDGLRRPYNHAAVTEDKERVEVLSGLSGFLYGAASPGGMVNYVYKRPTIERLNSVTIGNYGGSQYYAHGDFGGMIDAEGRAGYRLNVVKQDGNTAIDNQKIDRELVSGAFDWQITDKLLMQLNATYNHYKTDGSSAYWYYEVPHGVAPDSSKLWSQPWIHDEFNNTKLMGKLTYQLNDKITLRGAYMRDDIDRPVQDHTMNDVTSSSEYLQIRIRSGKTKDVFEAANGFADIAFDTGMLAHKLTVGYYTYSDKSYATTYSPNTGWLGPYTLSTPTYVPEANFPANTSSPYYAGRIRNENYMLGDLIRINEQWSALLGINHSRILSESYDSLGVKSQPDYDDSRNSPSVSLMYKPIPWLTTYASYIEGLEQGGIAPSTAANPNQILAPMVSKQREIGVKATVGGVLLTSAVFDIEKAYEYTDTDNVYKQNGRQNHKGIEFGATGKATDRLTVIAGLTLLDAKVKNSELDGYTPVNVAEQYAKIYSEYSLAGILSGLTLTGGVYYTGKQEANDINTDHLPGYVTTDIGMRYKTVVSTRPLTLRLNINNVTDKDYWLNSYYVGAPRTMAFSAQMAF